MTSAELAILSLIAEKPRHGYEIEAVIQARGMREWTEIGFSSIYYVLKRLEKAGQITSHMQHEGQGPARKVYQITPAGSQGLRAAVSAALAVPARAYPLIQLGLANLPILPRDEALAALRGYGERLTEQQAYVAARWQAQRPLPAHVDAMFDYSLTLLAAEKNWIETFIAQLEQGV